MRLSAAQTRVILHCIRQQFGADASVMLFGSRLDDAARGGDVDLLVESTAHATLRQRALVTMALEKALELPVDIVALQRGTPGSAFARIARSRAQPLENAA
jgi:predicted nucleotidyltransferase